MDFTVDSEQLALRDTLRRYLADPARPTTWTGLADLGVLGLLIPAEHGGSDLGAAEMMLVAQEVGRANLLEPFVDAVVVAAGLIDRFASAEQRGTWLPRIASGECLPILAHAEPRSRWSTAARGVTGEAGADGWTLTGVKEPVAHGAEADVLIVSADVDGETRLFLVEPQQPGVARTGHLTHDGSRGSRIVLDDATATSLGDGTIGEKALDDVFATGVVALCAEALGAMEAALDLTVEHLTTRQQFGVPLSSFQALTHRAADLYVELELARSMVLFATVDLASGAADPTAGSRAKLQISRAARRIGDAAIQLHGGVGVTDEYPIGHLVSRLEAIDRTLGDGDFHLDRLAADVRSHTAVELLS